MPYCPNCGKAVEEDARFCPSCGQQLGVAEGKEETAPTRERPAEKTDAIGALQRGISIITAKPMVLLPALIGAVASAVLSTIASWLFIPFGNWSSWIWSLPALLGLVAAGLILMLVGAIVSYIMTFASLDMSRDAYLDQELDFSGSINYVFRRILTFIVASIIGAILAITIILIPVVILMFVIMVIDETGIVDSISKAFRVLGDRLIDVIILIIIAIVAAFILGLIPFIGPILVAAFNVLVALAFIGIYYNYKKATAS